MHNVAKTAGDAMIVSVLEVRPTPPSTLVLRQHSVTKPTAPAPFPPPQTLRLWLAWPPNASPADPFFAATAMPQPLCTDDSPAVAAAEFQAPCAPSTAYWLLAAIDALEKAKHVSALAKLAALSTAMVLHLAQRHPRDADLVHLLARLLAGHAQPLPVIGAHRKALCEIIASCQYPRRLGHALFAIMGRAPGHPEIYGNILSALEKRDVRPSAGDPSVYDTGQPWQSAGKSGAAMPASAAESDDDTASGAAMLRPLGGRAATRAGLQNLGNTCYANAAVQALFTVAPFRRAVFDAASIADRGSHMRATRALFALLAGSKRRALRPASFLAACRPPWFPSGSQQDSAEFLVYWLDQLDREAQGAEATLNAVQHLTGTSVREVKCRRCGTASSREESFTAMPLPIVAEGGNDWRRARGVP